MAEVRAKLTRYEDLFGRRMTSIGQRLGMVRNKLAGVAVILDASPPATEDADSKRFSLIEIDERPAVAAPEDEGPVRKLEAD